MSTFWKMFLCSLRYCLKFYFSKGVYSFTLSTVYTLPTHLLCLPYYTISFGVVTSVPSPNQYCPGNSQGAPAHQSSRADRPHLRLINPPAHKQRTHRRRVRNLSMRQQPNLLSVPFQTPAKPSLGSIPDTSLTFSWFQSRHHPISTATSTARINPHLDTTENTTESKRTTTFHSQ